MTTCATALNVVWSLVLICQGEEHRSAALKADGKHLMADVVTSVGVLIGMTLVVVTRIKRLDPALAALVALHVLSSGWGVVRENASGLMDEAAPTDELARIREVIAHHADGLIEAHALKTRHAGKATFVDFHLVVPGGLPVSEAHAICGRIEGALRSDVPGTIVSIHVEPDGEAKHTGIVVL